MVILYFIRCDTSLEPEHKQHVFRKLKSLISPVIKVICGYRTTEAEQIVYLNLTGLGLRLEQRLGLEQRLTSSGLEAW